MSGKERGRKSPPEHLSPEDKLLWAHAMREAKPARRRRAPPTQTVEKPPSEGAKPAKARRPVRAQPPPSRVKEKTPVLPLAAGAVVNVDRRTAERLKRGQMTVEATLDLHGHTQAEAHRELNGFLARAHAAGRRCVLIITGKGASQSGGGGVLRTEVPKWLNEPGNRARILAFAGAQPRHGGGGALYVLLRRQRGE